MKTPLHIQIAETKIALAVAKPRSRLAIKLQIRLEQLVRQQLKREIRAA